MKHFFIYNPIAGQGVKGKAFLDTIASKSVNNSDLFLYITKGVGDATRYAKMVAEQYKDEDIAIYACGGDGTTSEVLNGIINKSNVLFGIIPTGSCNDFLKNYHEYDFLNIDKQLNGYPVTIDAMKIGGRFGLNVTNIGFDSRVNADQIRYRPKFKTIKGAYNYAIFQNIIHFPKDYVCVKVDDKVLFSGKSLLMAIANGKYYGGGFKCAPDAIIDDGLIDVVVVKKVSVLTFLKLVKKYKKGEHLKDKRFKNIIYFNRGKNISIQSQKPLSVCIDGDNFIQNQVDISIMPQSIRFILPAKNN